MAKSMKVPILVFEHIQEPLILLEGLDRVLKDTEPSSTEEQRALILLEELKKIQIIIEKTNIR
jgi:hypothetical protein